MNPIMFEHITVCLDMHGCPNRCKHCWIGHSNNGNLTEDDLRFAAESFRPLAKKLTVYDWYREPDFPNDYQRLYSLCHELSDADDPHFELISVFRIARDPAYADWLSSLGLRYAQLTLFGGEAKTDYYTGRKGAYRDILKAIDVLLAHHISPRLQFFANKDNIGELPLVEKLIDELKLPQRCQAFGGNFTFFLHQGSCDGENANLYDIRVTPEDLKSIPPRLAEYTLSYFGKSKIEDVFGETEQALCQRLSGNPTTQSYVTDDPVFYIDGNLNAYPNITSPSPIWLLGNLKDDGAEAIARKYQDESSLAQHIRKSVPLGEIVKKAGNEKSLRLFDEGDFIVYCLNKYCLSL